MCFEGCDPRVRTQKRESTTARSQKSAACCAPRATYSRRSRTSFPTTNLPPSPRADPPPRALFPGVSPARLSTHLSQTSERTVRIIVDVGLRTATSR